jgi:hypothetical protein
MSIILAQVIAAVYKSLPLSIDPSFPRHMEHGPRSIGNLV